MIKKALIIVPHQDDELNVAAPLLSQLVDANIEITVCFVTNGDYDGNQEVRLKEAKKVSHLFNNWKIIYLGYGDGGYIGALYNSKDDDSVVKSPSGHTETYGVGDIIDYHYQNYNEHSLYSKRKLLNDIQDCILRIKADLIFCIDMDEHPDHKLVSEIFDSAMQQIVQNTDYCPLVLKKFAYLGCWYGPCDYFIRPMIPTQCITTIKHDNSWNINEDLWTKRICFAVCKKDYPLRFWKSRIFKAYKCYKSQNGGLFFFSAINSDAIYWFYNTKNGIYEVSTDFPVEETPFKIVKTEEPVKVRKGYIFYISYIIYKIYVKIQSKIARKFRNGF